AVLLVAVAVIAGACRRQHPLAPYIAYVVNQQSSTLAAVNLAEFRVTASLPVAARPERVVARPGARELYVVSPLGKTSVVAFPDLRVLATLDVGSSARDLQFSPDGRTACVLAPVEHELVFIDAAPRDAKPDTAVPIIAARVRLAGTPRALALT